MSAPHIDCPPRPPKAPHTDKEPSLKYQNVLPKPAVTLSDMERALLDFWGTQTHTGPFQSWNGPPNLTFLFLFIFILFLVRQIGPLPQNSGPNPMSFQFLVGVYWGPMKFGPLLEEILATRVYHPEKLDIII